MKTIRKNNKYGRQIIAFLLLTGFALINAYTVITKLFAVSYLQGILYLGGMAAITSLFTLCLILYKRYREEEILYLMYSDIYLLIKLPLIVLAIISGSFMPVCAILLYEQWNLKPTIVGKWMDYILPQKEDRREEDIDLLVYYSIYPLVLLLLPLTTETISFKIKTIIGKHYMLEPITTLKSLPYWLSSLALLMLGAYISSGSIRPLFTLQEKSDRGNKSYFSNPLKNFSWVLISFLIASPTIFLPIYIFGWQICLITLCELFSSSNYILYALSQCLFYSIQPLVEEMVFRALFFHYCASIDLCQKDYTKMSLIEKLLYSLLNGAVFAFVHQNVRRYRQLKNFVPLFLFGVLTSMLTFINGRIDLATFEHSFHNIACSLCPEFLSLWFMEGLELSRFVTPITSSAAKYSIVKKLGSIFASKEVGSTEIRFKKKLLNY